MRKVAPRQETLFEIKFQVEHNCEAHDNLALEGLLEADSRLLNGTFPQVCRFNAMACDTPSVLIVEDEAFVAWDLSQAVENAGNAVVGPAASLSSALEYSQDEHVCAAVLDINLGDETVWPLADSLQERGIPFGFISANLRHSELSDCFPAAPTLSKPVRERDLIAMVDELVLRSSC